MKLMNENITDSSRDDRIVFYLNKEYASEYSRLLICRRFTTTLDFSFLHITKTDKEADDMIFSDTF